MTIGMQFEGICMMCRKPMLVHTVGIDGKQRPFCPECLELVEAKTKMALEKRGKQIRGKEMNFGKAK